MSTTPTRPPRAPAFEENPEDEYQEAVEGTAAALDRLPNKRDAKHLTPVPPLKPSDGAGERATTPGTDQSRLSMGQTAQPPSPDSSEESTGPEPEKMNTSGNSAVTRQAEPARVTNGSVHRISDAPSRGVGARTTGAHIKPPAPWVSFDVYSRLTEFSESEKRTKRSAARPFGAIVMDAIEHHSDALASTWKNNGSDSPPAGKLFVREKNSRYRRHAMPPRSITLQGMSPDNAKLLKKLQKQWGAGSVSDLVEQALRFEFGM